MKTPYRLIAQTIGILVFLAIALLLRLFLVVRRTHLTSTHHKRQQKLSAEPRKTCSIAVLLGSGGHTGEMIRLLEKLDFKVMTPRVYVVSSGDGLSRGKALALEKQKGVGDFSFLMIPRARKVHQSFLTTPFTTLHSLLYCFYHMCFLPLLAGGARSGSHEGKKTWMIADLVLLNGPGSCVPIALSTFLPRIFNLPSPHLIYVESFARIQSLSLSGKILRPFVDRFVVQWKELKVLLEDKEKALRKWGLVGEPVCETFVL